MFLVLKNNKTKKKTKEKHRIPIKIENKEEQRGE